MNFECVGRRNHCSWDCCSKSFIQLSLNDVLELVPSEIGYGEVGFQVEERKEHYRLIPYLDKGKGACKFLERIGDTTSFQCGLEHEGFGLDVCKTWPARITPSSEGGFELCGEAYSVGPAGSCEAFLNLKHGEVGSALTGLLKEHRGILERGLRHNKWFTNYLSGRRVFEGFLVNEIMEWGGDEVSGDGFFEFADSSGNTYSKTRF